MTEDLFDVTGSQAPATSRVESLLLWLLPSGFTVAASGWVLYLAATQPDRLLGFVPDDAFYYFGVAEHLRAGWWFSFDGLTLTNGFHPLWTLIITPVLWMAGHDFVPVLVLGAVLTALAVALLARTVAHLWDTSTAVAFSVLMVLNPALFTHAVNGLETGLLLSTSSGLLWLVFVRRVRSSRDAALLGVATAAVCLSRTDAALLSMLVWCVVAAQHRRDLRAGLPLLLWAGGVAAVLVAPWFIFNQVVFGSVIQDSGRAFAVMEQRYHEAHGSLDILATRPQAILISGLQALGGWLGLPSAVAALGVAAGGVCALWRRRVSRVQAAFVGVLLVYGVGILLAGAWRLVIREWYLAPLIALAMLLLALVCSLLPRRSLSYVCALFVGLFITFQGRAALRQGPWPDQSVEPGIIRVVAARLPADARVGNSDAGMWGWFAPFTTINLDGLANSAALPAIEQGRLLDYIRERGIGTFFFGRTWWREPWLMGPGSGLLYENEVVTEAGRRPDGTEVIMSKVLQSNDGVVSRFGRSTIETSDPEFTRWLGDGWAIPPAPSAEEIWSVAGASDIYLPVPNGHFTQATVWLNAIGSPSRSTRIQVLVNDRPAGVMDVTNAASHQPYVIAIPPSDRLAAKVRLEYDRTWKPSELGVSADSRSLAVSIIRIAMSTGGPARKQKAPNRP